MDNLSPFYKIIKIGRPFEYAKCTKYGDCKGPKYLDGGQKSSLGCMQTGKENGPVGSELRNKGLIL